MEAIALPSVFNESDIYQFQRNLYERMDAATRQENQSLLISFQADGRRYALDGKSVERVSAEHGRIVKLPNTKTWLRGVANLAGEIVSVVDLSVLAGGPPMRLDNTILIAVTRQYDIGCAFLAEEVENTTTLTDLTSPIADGNHAWLPEYYAGASPLYRLDLAILFAFDWFKIAFEKGNSQ